MTQKIKFYRGDIMGRTLKAYADQKLAEKLKNLIAEERNNIKTNANKKPEK